jgi:hypothetical protein
MTTSQQQLTEHWQRIRQEAIEVAIIAERQLIAMGQMDEQDRRVFTRKESRVILYSLSCQPA